MILLAASTHVELVDDVYQIPPGQWRYVEQLGLRQKPALVSADFQVRSGPPEVRLALMRREDLERLRDDRPHGVLEATEPAASGHIRHQVRAAGDYVLLIDNRQGRDQPAQVHLRVALDFAAPLGPAVSSLSAARQITVIAISFAVFFAIAGFSARRLLRGINR
ncbi:MAG TPA: hypothetical protein VKT49_16360 [Bryobacteraceae bacterium]|nr:hypothetical protein [Bryobacteraceae bacterium]